MGREGTAGVGKLMHINIYAFGRHFLAKATYIQRNVTHFISSCNVTVPGNRTHDLDGVAACATVLAPDEKLIRM